MLVHISVSTDLHIKLADFGLSRETNEKNYYKMAGKAMLPVRWMAPECLIYGIFTAAADIWYITKFMTHHINTHSYYCTLMYIYKL